MAKIQIKSEKLTPFGGIFSIMEKFDSMLSPVIGLGENNMGKGFIDEAEENRWHPLAMFSTEPGQFSCRAYKTRAESLVELSPLQVGMTRLELATSRPPDVCATNCATSRNLSFVLQR